MFEPILNGNQIIGTYNYWLVLLSYVIAAFTSYTALNLAMRIGESSENSKKFWVGGCAFAMGGGIWAMHFTGMLAFNLPISVSYDLRFTLISLLIPIFAAGTAFFYTTQKPIILVRVFLGGIIMGSGVAVMHYSGMQAVNFMGSMFYKPGLFIASVFIAIAASTVALALIIYFGSDDKRTNLKYKVIGALIMGLAVSGMHYTGMEATVFISNGPISPNNESTASVSIIISSILGIILLVLILATIASITQGEFNTLKFIKGQLEKEVEKRTTELKVLASFPSESISPIFRVSSHNILLYSNSSGLSFLQHWNCKLGDEIPSPFIENLNKGQPKEEINKLEISQGNETFEFDIVNIPEMEYFNIYGHNITKRKVAEKNIILAKEEAEKASQAKTEFLAHISHEIRTPMNAILGFTELIRIDSDNPFPDCHREKLNQISSSGKHLLKIINELLDLSSIESGNLKLSIEEVDIISVVEDVVSTCQLIASKNNIKIEHQTTPNNKILIEVDLIRIKQVILNLISNAIKYNKPNGKVIISYDKSHDHQIRIGIKDNGPGISQDNICNVFKPFERFHPQAENIEGTGIGLTISKQLIELMSGEIGFESFVDKGCHFYIDLPLSSNSITEKEMRFSEQIVSPSKSSQAKRKKVLYIEDVKVNIELVKHILSLRDNLTFFSATKALPGIELAKSELPDLILMDLRLPDMDGITAFKQLQLIKELKHIPVMALTANAIDGESEKALSLGFKNYITKPINIDHFLKEIDKLLS